MKWNVLQPIVLAIRENGTYEPFSAEAWKYAGEMTLLGMGMIFTVLALLWGVLAIFKMVFANKPKKDSQADQGNEGSAPGNAVASEPSDDVISAVIAAGIQAYREDESRELIAVITAAVAAYRAEEGSTGDFRVVSFKRASGARSWNRKK